MVAIIHTLADIVVAIDFLVFHPTPLGPSREGESWLAVTVEISAFPIGVRDSDEPVAFLSALCNLLLIRWYKPREGGIVKTQYPALLSCRQIYPTGIFS